jgi:hypothetical protein
VQQGLRVFVGSTMGDLANERAAVIRRLRQFNFEPVHAEGLLPTGAGTWEVLREEVRSSDLFVLVLGESYGWLPPSGPGAGTGKSVTELEYDEAVAAGVPVFPFVKRLGAAADRTSADAGLRDAFRDQVQGWDGGHYRAQFDLAHDLAEQVGQALVYFLSDRHRQLQVRDRREQAGVAAPPELPPPDLARLPPALIEAVAEQAPILLVGAGVSLGAGLPSAAAFIEAMVERIRRADQSYWPPASGSLFFAVATDLEALLGRPELEQTVDLLVRPDFLPAESPVHTAALDLFDLVLTTNYDELLEQSARGSGRPVITGDRDGIDLGRPAIVKLHGTISDPPRLLLTEADLAGVEHAYPALRAALREQLATRPLIAVGTSLRDPSIVALLESCGPDLRGWAVADGFALASRARLKRWNLVPLEADAGVFLATLQQALAARPV